MIATCRFQRARALKISTSDPTLLPNVTPEHQHARPEGRAPQVDLFLASTRVVENLGETLCLDHRSSAAVFQARILHAKNQALKRICSAAVVREKCPSQPPPSCAYPDASGVPSAALATSQNFLWNTSYVFWIHFARKVNFLRG